jgi:hypothetical protein
MKERNPEANCSNCPFWETDDEGYSGFCYALPRQIETSLHHYCGQHPQFFQKKTRKEAVLDYSPEFNEFWDLYRKLPGNAGNKMTANARYKRLIAGTVDQAIVLEKVTEYGDFLSAQFGRGFAQSCKHASTWINQRGWEDDYTIEGGENVSAEDISGILQRRGN